jgi:hypothetical protein
MGWRRRAMEKLVIAKIVSGEATTKVSGSSFAMHSLKVWRVIFAIFGARPVRNPRANYERSDIFPV